MPSFISLKHIESLLENHDFPVTERVALDGERSLMDDFIATYAASTANCLHQILLLEAGIHECQAEGNVSPEMTKVAVAHETAHLKRYRASYNRAVKWKAALL